jgi:hypothetical protein
VLFVLTVVATPREAFLAFGLFALILLGLMLLGQIPVSFVTPGS